MLRALRIALKQGNGATTNILFLPPHLRLAYLALRFVERNQKGNYFRETQYSGRSIPVSSIGWLWFNGALLVAGTFALTPNRTHISDDFPPSLGEKSKMHLGESLPLSLISIE